MRAIAGTSAPIALMMMKKQVWRHMNRELGVAAAETSRWIDESLARDDFKEGVASFLEKRPPRFAKVEVD